MEKKIVQDLASILDFSGYHGDGKENFGTE
jgi:hypothetical protein